MINRIANDCEYLSNLIRIEYNIDKITNSTNISPESIKDLLIHVRQDKINLLYRFYNNETYNIFNSQIEDTYQATYDVEYKISDKELSDLLDVLNYLQCKSKIRLILGLMKYKSDDTYFIEIMNPNLVQEFRGMILYSDILQLFAANDILDPIVEYYDPDVAFDWALIAARFGAVNVLGYLVDTDETTFRCEIQNLIISGVRYDHYPILKLLLDRGFDIEDKHLNRLLTYAIGNRSYQIMGLLLDNINHEKIDYDKYISMATKNKDTGMANLLRSRD